MIAVILKVCATNCGNLLGQYESTIGARRPNWYISTPGVQYITYRQGDGDMRIDLRESVAIAEKPSRLAEAAFILTALAIIVALFYVVPDVWWGVNGGDQ